jgi:hypothetical protein
MSVAVRGGDLWLVEEALDDVIEARGVETGELGVVAAS